MLFYVLLTFDIIFVCLFVYIIRVSLVDCDVIHVSPADCDVIMVYKVNLVEWQRCNSSVLNKPHNDTGMLLQCQYGVSVLHVCPYDTSISL